MKTQRALSDEQERIRLDGLRVLARIIARRTLTHPGRCADHSPEEWPDAPPNERVQPVGERIRRDGIA